MSKLQAKANKNLKSQSKKMKVAKKPSSKFASKSPSKSKAIEKSQDIIPLILADHKPLKKLIKILKDADGDFSMRKSALKQFGPLLMTHAHSEEKALYKFMEKLEELREESYEGEVEHQLAEQMLKAALSETNEDMWSAKAKVLAELVEHHIEEEEEEMLPDFKKESSAEERGVIGEKYLQYKKQMNSISPEVDIKDSVDREDENSAESDENDSVQPSH